MFYSFCKLFFFCFVIPLCQPVNVNMHGKFSLGKDVVDTLTYYIKQNFVTSKHHKKEINRRALPDMTEDISPPATNNISIIIKSETICSDINFCHGSTETFVEDYLIALTEVLEKIFADLIQDKTKYSEIATNIFIFDGSLKRLLKEVKEVLIKLNDEKLEESNIFIWIRLLKKLNILYLDKAMAFCLDRLEGTDQEIEAIKRKLLEKLVIATAYVELDFERKLCVEHKICMKNFYCTKSLNSLLEIIANEFSDKLNAFVKDFYEALLETNFYTHLNETTGNEFQSILLSMADADKISSKEVFNAVKQSVGSRMETISTGVDKPVGKDVKLMHVILSNMDYFYDKHNYNPFEEIVVELEDWPKAGGIIKDAIRKVMTDITNNLANMTSEMVGKLKTEVMVFMNLTVAPSY